MPVFLVAFGLVYGLVQVYLYSKFRLLCPLDRQSLFAWIWLAFSLLVVVLPAKEITQIFGKTEPPAWLYGVTFTWLGGAFLLTCAFGFLDVIRLVVRACGYGTFSAWLNAPMTILSVSVVVAIGVGVGLYQARQTNVVFATIQTEKLPPDVARFRIVALADLHLNPLFRGDKLAEVMTTVAAQNPDIVVVIGDTVERNMADYGPEAQILKQHGARLGAFVVEGNHEHFAGITQALAFLRKTGMTLLRNEAVDVGPIALIGETDPTRGPESPPPAATLDYTSRRGSKDRFTILLKHQPRFDPAAEQVVDLQLSGHTHGGQIWPFYWATRLAYDYQPGLFKRNRLWVHVTNGAGFWGPPIRLFAPPEIVVIDLVRAEP